MSNLPGDGRIELMIKCYPGGRFSGLLEGAIRPGDAIGFTGPYGAFHLRRSRRPVLMLAGGSGMAPIMSLLRQLSGERSERMVRFYYGARTARDLFALDEIEALGSALADFRFAPVLSEAGLGDPEEIARGFVHEFAAEYVATGEMEDFEAYMCGPPPMIDAATEALSDHGVEETRIFYDKFTIAADAAERSEA
jgi:propane monooxygenase reductase subunit